jgi:hypothetical protein
MLQAYATRWNVRVNAGLLTALWMAVAGAGQAAVAQDVNIMHRISYIEERLQHAPVEVLTREQARPSIAGDRSQRVSLAGEGGLVWAKWKPVARSAEGFNNEPRYDLAAYQLQKLYLDEPHFVVPPVALRAMDLASYRQIVPGGEATFRGISSVLFTLSYWVQSVTNLEPYNAARFEADPVYAMHWANVNILTHIIDHKDSNVGNILISEDPSNPRVFAVDNDVAFRARDADVGSNWKRLHVRRLPKASIDRLRAVTLQDLEATLGVLVEFKVENGLLHPVEVGENLNAGRGVRVTRERVQFGLTSREIQDVHRKITDLLGQVDAGRITTF